jgi:hypothetical protein
MNDPCGRNKSASFRMITRSGGDTMHDGEMSISIFWRAYFLNFKQRLQSLRVLRLSNRIPEFIDCRNL